MHTHTRLKKVIAQHSEDVLHTKYIHTHMRTSLKKTNMQQQNADTPHPSWMQMYARIAQYMYTHQAVCEIPANSQFLKSLHLFCWYMCFNWQVKSSTFTWGEGTYTRCMRVVAYVGIDSSTDLSTPTKEIMLESESRIPERAGNKGREHSLDDVNGFGE